MKLLAICLLSVTCFAQDAVVTELSKVDAARAKELYEAKKYADAAYSIFTDRIAVQYNLQFFEFSKDFRFIVPKPATQFTPSCCPANTICLTPNSYCGTFINPVSGSNFVLN